METASEEVEVHQADLRGLRCPLPALKTRARLRALPDGARLEVLTDDPLASIDIPALCNETGQALVEQEEVGEGETRFLIQRRGVKVGA